MDRINYPLTKQISYNFNKLTELQKLLEKATKPVPFWQSPVPVKDQITILRELAEAKTDLWQEVYRVYPELTGKLLTIDSSQIWERETTEE